MPEAAVVETGGVVAAEAVVVTAAELLETAGLVGTEGVVATGLLAGGVVEVC